MKYPNLKHLHYLVVLFEEQHFHRAAARCFIGQSTLSTAIQNLEEQCGQQILERDNKQFVFITKEEYDDIAKSKPILSTDLVEFVEDNSKQLYPIPIGSSLNGLSLLNHSHDGNTTSVISPKSELIKTAFLYLNAPYLWGGKTPFGIDCSGFTQMVYKLNGHKLLRDASLQATQGEALSFIEESEPGDLAFFDNNEGLITHVGIIMQDNYIIHAHGKVRIDRLDHSGIYNVDSRTHTHKLRVIKKII